MLDGYTAHSSTDPEVTRHYLANKNVAFHPESRTNGFSGGFNARINALQAPDLYIAYMAYDGADVALETPAERPDYGFSAPLSGRMSSIQSGERIDCTESRTALASPGVPQSLKMDAGTGRLSISLGRHMIRRRFAALSGMPVEGEIIFDAGLDLRAGPGKLVYEGMRLIAEEAENGTNILADPLRYAHFEDMALSTLLLYQPHSHQAKLGRRQGAPASRDVKRVIDYIHAHLETPIRLEDLVRIADVPGRTLNDHFRTFTGLAPMAYLRQVRLAAVRDALLCGEAQSVTEAATRFGFFQMGRFAAVYSEAFGETPSDTLALARRRAS